MSDSSSVSTEPGATCCLPVTTAPAAHARCPCCSQQGKAVSIETVKSQLAISLHALTQAAYRFCATPDCPVVYFASESEQQFMTDQIRERVYQKLPDHDEVLVCYCFRHPSGLLRSGDTAAQAAIIADITGGITQGQCACELRNPQGTCCLGNVRALARSVHHRST